MELTIESMTEQDFDTLYTWYKDPAYGTFFRNTPEDLSRDALTVLMTTVGVVLKSNTPDKNMVALAFIMVYPKTHIADIGIITDKHYRKQGIASTLVKKLIDYIFKEGTVNRIVMYSPDPSIIAALKRGGFYEECRMYKNTFFNGKLHNESRMILTKDFYNKLGR